MNLFNACLYPGAEEYLWELLQERTPEQSISHKKMPTWDDHVAFFRARPYESWYLIGDTRGHAELVAATDIVGAVYLSKQQEIGVAVFERFRGKGYAKWAIKELMRLHPKERYLANINPANEASIKLFQSLGFGGPIQVTYELETSR